jgi:hypothetical protein
MGKIVILSVIFSIFCALESFTGNDKCTIVLNLCTQCCYNFTESTLTCPTERSEDDSLNVLRKLLCDYDPYMMPKVEKGSPLKVNVDFKIVSLSLVRRLLLILIGIKIQR